MTQKETSDFLKRIKSHYQEFIVDDYKIQEWYQALKDFDFEDVNRKLESHLRSETYGESIPKVYFLTKYLTPSKDKGKIEKFKINCPICNECVTDDEFDKHYSKCLSIEYLSKQSIKYKNQELDKEKYKNMSDEEFEKKYDAICEYVLKKTEDLEEKGRLSNYFELKIGSTVEQVKLNI